jgi:hypothetical protein
MTFFYLIEFSKIGILYLFTIFLAGLIIIFFYIFSKGTKDNFFNAKFIRGSLLINKLHFLLGTIILFVIILIFSVIIYQYWCLLAKMHADFSMLEAAFAAQAIELQEATRALAQKLVEEKVSVTIPPKALLSDDLIVILVQSLMILAVVSFAGGLTYGGYVLAFKHLCFGVDGGGGFNEIFVDTFWNETSLQLIQSTGRFNIKIQLHGSLVFVDLADFISIHQDTFDIYIALLHIE